MLRLFGLQFAEGGNARTYQSLGRVSICVPVVYVYLDLAGGDNGDRAVILSVQVIM